LKQFLRLQKVENEMASVKTSLLLGGKRIFQKLKDIISACGGVLCGRELRKGMILSDPG
jgi:hypothetical protein